MYSRCSGSITGPKITGDGFMQPSTLLTENREHTKTGEAGIAVAKPSCTLAAKHHNKKRGAHNTCLAVQETGIYCLLHAEEGTVQRTQEPCVNMLHTHAHKRKPFKKSHRLKKRTEELISFQYTMQLLHEDRSVPCNFSGAVAANHISAHKYDTASTTKGAAEVQLLCRRE